MGHSAAFLLLLAASCTVTANGQNVTKAEKESTNNDQSVRKGGKESANSFHEDFPWKELPKVKTITYMANSRCVVVSIFCILHPYQFYIAAPWSVSSHVSNKLLDFLGLAITSHWVVLDAATKEVFPGYLIDPIRELNMDMERVLETHLHINCLVARPPAVLKEHRSSILFQVKYTRSSLSTILSHQLTYILMAFISMEMGTVMVSFVKRTPECVWNIYLPLTRYVLVALVYHCVSDEAAHLT